MANNSTYKVNINSSDFILNQRGLLPGGKAQKFFANELIRKSDPYAPFDRGVLKNSATIAIDGTYIEYNVPYARVHWYGKVMAGSLPKKPTNKDMQYRGSPKRGPKWVLRMWNVEKDSIIKSVERFVERGK